MEHVFWRTCFGRCVSEGLTCSYFGKPASEDVFRKAWLARVLEGVLWRTCFGGLDLLVFWRACFGGRVLKGLACLFFGERALEGLEDVFWNACLGGRVLEDVF